MAEAKDNILTRGFSGTISKLLTFRQRAGRTFVGKSRRAGSGLFTDKVAAVRLRFLASIVYAKRAIKDPATKAMYYAARQDGQTAYNVAFADAFLAPKVNSIDTGNYHGAAGDTILVNATDDFKVTGVAVSIHNAAGDLVEEGDAVMDINETDWLYTAKQANAALAGSTVTAVAKDLPGNSTSFSVNL
jgi:hypothetical protein